MRGDYLIGDRLKRQHYFAEYTKKQPFDVCRTSMLRTDVSTYIQRVATDFHTAMT